MADASWSVVCTTDEPLPLLAAFAIHYLDLGAAEVHLYLDTPRPGHVEFLSTIAGLRVTACDRAYWRGRRKKTVESRQQHNAFDAYHRTATDWLCHVDSDEFLFASTGEPVASILARQPDNIDFLAVPMRERIYRAGQPIESLFDGACVSPYKLAHDNPAPTPALRRRDTFSAWGLLGHALGKSFLRTGQPLVVGIHRPRPSEDHPRRDLGRNAFRMHRSRSLHLIHFDGLTPFHWIVKLWRMARLMPDDKLALQGPGRKKLIRRTRITLPEIAPLRVIGQELRHLDPDSIAALGDAGRLHDLPRDPADPVVARGLLPRSDFHPDAFDNEMVRMYPAAKPLLNAWRALETANSIV